MHHRTSDHPLPRQIAGICLSLLAGVASLIAGLAPVMGQAPDAAEAEGAAPAIENPFLLTEPDTPEEFLRAALQAQRLVRPKLALLYLQQFWAANPSDELLLQLREELGPAAFARLANQPELQPLSITIAKKVTRLFRERGATPEHINKLIEDLAGRASIALAAHQALVNTGPQAVPIILERLQEEGAPAAIREELIEILSEMGPQVLPPLHAVLESDDRAIVLPALHVIGEVGTRLSMAHLFKFAYGPDVAPRFRLIARQALEEIARRENLAPETIEPIDVSLSLHDQARRILAGQGPITPRPGEGESGQQQAVRVWMWNPSADRLVSAMVPPRQARLRLATLLARDAFRISPQRRDAQAFYLATRLGLEAAQADRFAPPVGPGTTFHAILAAGPELAQATLHKAIAAQLPRAMVGTIAVLARVGSPNLLFGGETALRDALDAPHPRVQLAAAVAILRINPDRTFRESERIVAILARALSESGKRTAVIIDPDDQRGATLAGLVRELGFDSVVANSGQEGFRLATERTTPALILVNLNVDQWPLRQTIANFRADRRTQSTPIVVVGPPVGLWDAETDAGTEFAFLSGASDRNPRHRVERLLSGIPKTGYLVATSSSDAFYAQITPILAAEVPTELSVQDRLRAREIAAYWLAQIADRGLTERYPLAQAEQALAGAIFAPDLGRNALIALAAIPTPTAQTTIGTALIGGALPASELTLAAELLADHIRRYGLLMPADLAQRLARDPASAQSPELRQALTALAGLLRTGPADVAGEIRKLPPLLVGE